MPKVSERLVEVLELDLVVLLAHGVLAGTLQVWAEVGAIGGVGHQGHLRWTFLGLHGRICEQVLDLDPQSDCQHLQSVNGWVGSTALDTAHVRASEPAPVREGFLAHASARAELSDAGTKFLADVDFVHTVTVAACDIKGHAPIVGALKVTYMLNRRSILLTFLASLLVGCAAPPADVPRYQWGQIVDFGGLSFTFNSAQSTKSFSYSRNLRAESADGFIIVDVSMTNILSSPIKAEFQPVFRLVDDAGRLYEHSPRRTLQINIGKGNSGAVNEVINPGTTLRRELVFEAPKGHYVLQVMVPSHLQMAFAGSIKKTGSYFIYDISSQL